MKSGLLLQRSIGCTDKHKEAQVDRRSSQLTGPMGGTVIN
jgi:hypothetical protein